MSEALELAIRVMRRNTEEPSESWIAVVPAPPWLVLKGWEENSQKEPQNHGTYSIHCRATPRRGGLGTTGGPMKPTGPTPREFTSAVVAALLVEGTNDEDTLALVCPVIERFGAFVQDGLGIRSVEDLEPSHVEAFMDALRMDGSPPVYGTRRVRRMALRMAFRTGRHLGLCRVDPTLDVELGPNASVSARRLFQSEVELCRIYAVPGPRDGRRCIAWALAEATARTGEMGLVRISDLDLARERIWLPGAPGADARWGYFTNWGLGQVLRRIGAEADPNTSLIVWRREPKNTRAASSQALTETLKAAGLNALEIRPRSITAWAGRRLFDDGAPLDEVARRLGMRSLDQTASFIGFDWRSQEGA
jgi:integrase/recombinase XerC